MSTALTAVIESMPDQLRQSITWDQGSEMACHDKITTNTGVPIYFCDRTSPWQRPLRLHAEDLAAIETELNNRPRKVLGWKTPAQVLASLMAEDQ